MLTIIKKSSAFTLVELLASIGIISVLVGMLLPAVQSVRARARASQCKSQLRQVSLAVANYASSHRKFPPGNSLKAWVVEGTETLVGQ